MDVLLIPRTKLWLRSPVIAASGTFGYGVEFALRNKLTGLGAVVSKGTTPTGRAGNTAVRLTETPAGMLNSIGLQNVGVDMVIDHMAPAWSALPVPVFVNISGTSVDEYAGMAAKLDGVSGIAGLEVNVSCPNIKEGGVAFGTDPRMASEVTTAVRKRTQLPVIVKLSPNVTDVRPIAAAVEMSGADAISLINTVYGMAIDTGCRQPVLSTVSGGLSGPAVRPLALHLVYQVAQEVEIPIIGIGGILTADDALQFIMAGATAVAMATALLVDPFRCLTVSREIDTWCADRHVFSLSEVRGAANPGFRLRKDTMTGELFAAGH